MSGPSVALGVSVGAVVAAGVYVLWGPDTRRRRGRCAGLRNLGNTCFVNAVLQALASTGAVVEWLQSSGGGTLTRALERTLSCLREDEGVVSPAPILQGLAHHGWSVDTQQQDAHELYHVFLTSLAEETTTYSSLLGETPPPPLLGTRSVAYGRAGPITTLPHSPSTVCPLQGLLASELVCHFCQHTSPVMYEVFDSLSLNLPLGQRECELQSCLLDFIKTEAVADVNCSACSKLLPAGPGTKRTFLKQLSLARLPHILCLHFKRTVWLPSGHLHKCSVSVTFPSQLDLSFLCKGRLRGCHYKLVAVIEHLGGPLSGHYITYRQVQARQWAYTSDTSVHSSSLTEVLGSIPYMLFYQQVKF